MFAVKTDGTMYYRHTKNGPSTWDPMTKVSGGWAPH